MEIIEGQIKRQFIPSKVADFANIKLIKNILNNDIYEKWEAVAEVKGEYIICNDISKSKKYNKILKKQSYDEYLDFISKRDIDKDKWVYNILDGNAEQDKIIYKDELCLVLPAYVWDGQNINKLHILCMPIDKFIRTIRELTKEHIPLLEHMKQSTLNIISEKYGLQECNLKIFFHYDPSTYHLHIHFINTIHTETGSSVEYSHDLDNVIFNLQMDTDYYKKINLNIRV